MQHDKMQYLYWSLSKPIKYLGLTVDEWIITAVFLSFSFVLMNTGSIRVGFLFFLGSFANLYFLKKMKRFAKNFGIKSFLIAHRVLARPQGLPNTYKIKRVGR